MTSRVLVARINDHRVGELVDDNGVWSFRYDTAWLDGSAPYPLGTGLPLQADPIVDGSTRRPVQWYFDNLLPEEGQRTLLARDARIPEADAFGLLAYYGAESAGSLSLLPPDAPVPEAATLLPLEDTEIQRRIENLPQIPLTHDAAKRMSLAGAQHKLAVTLVDGKLFEPADAAPSTHILKPNHPGEHFPHSVINEYFIMRLAERMGLRVPRVHRRYVPAPIYLIDRFDRSPVGGQVQRLHAIDACQLIDLAPGFKYTEGSMVRLADLADRCRARLQARVRLFEWLVFNVLTGNTDAHLKNLSFMVGPEGVALAPHYDLICTAVYEAQAFNGNRWPDLTELAWPILGVSRVRDISQAVLVSAGNVLSLNAATTRRIIKQMAGRIVERASNLLAEIEAENAKPGRDLPGELRCLRAIVHVVIREMAKQLTTG